MAQRTYDANALAGQLGTPAFEAEWRTVFADFHASLYRYCLVRLRGAKDDCDDIVAMVWGRAWEKAHHLRGQGAVRRARLGSWLAKIEHHVLVDRGRTEVRERRKREDASIRLALLYRQRANQDADILTRLADASERQRLESHLTPGQREFLRLRIDEGLEHIEIADRLGLSSEGVSQTTWWRICKKLRKVA